MNKVLKHINRKLETWLCSVEKEERKDRVKLKLDLKVKAGPHPRNTIRPDFPLSSRADPRSTAHRSGRFLGRLANPCFRGSANPLQLHVPT